MKIHKVAQLERDRLPFNFYRVEGGKPDVAITIKREPITIFAFTAEQARTLLLDRYPQLRAYVDGCRGRNQECDIVARLNKEKLREIQNYNRVKKEMKDELADEAWWKK